MKSEKNTQDRAQSQNERIESANNFTERGERAKGYFLHGLPRKTKWIKKIFFREVKSQGVTSQKCIVSFLKKFELALSRFEHVYSIDLCNCASLNLSWAGVNKSRRRVQVLTSSNLSWVGLNKSRRLVQVWTSMNLS